MEANSWLGNGAQLAFCLQLAGGPLRRTQGLWDSPVLQAHALKEPGEGRVDTPGISRLRLSMVVPSPGQ